MGLRALLDRHPGFTVVDEASNAKEAVQKALQHHPEVVVMDIRLPGGSGIDACREIVAEAPDIKVIMLTSFAEDDMLFEAIAAGAAGYVLKQIGGDDLVRAIEAVGRGEALLDSALTQRVFARVREAQRKDEQSAFSQLTEQEMRVLGLGGGRQDQPRNRTAALPGRRHRAQLRQQHPQQTGSDQPRRSRGLCRAAQHPRLPDRELK